MQVLTLEFEGIGPFTERHTLDVRALGEGGLFLLEGPTGSGKTTIIDAIVFALYGDVAGVDSSKGRLVSTSLRPGCEPYVELTLETSRGLLRVRRVPQHERRKARGSGTTVGKAAIKLWKLAHPGDEGTLLSTSLQEATEELQRAIGLTKEQFTQTVVLPQGHFATFLRAKPEDRRGVLQDIFGTEFYDRCARQLVALAHGFRGRDAAARVALDQAAASFALVAWPADDLARQSFFDSLPSDAAGAVALAASRVGELEALAERAAASASEAQTVASGTEAALRVVVERNEAIVERRGLVARLAELQGAASEVAGAVQRLAEAERAEHARHPSQAVVRARAAAEAAQAEASRGLASAAESPDADLAELARADLEAAGIEARETRSALTALVEAEAALAGRAEALKLDVDRLASRRAALRAERERVEADRAAASDLAPELAGLTTIADTRAACVALEVEAQGRLAAVRRMEGVAAEFVAAREAERLAGQQAATAAATHESTRAAWLAGLAGTLAAGLTGGEPCPVCGSKHHPAPAEPPAKGVDRAAVERLEAASRAAERAFAAAKAHSDALATALSDQQQQVGSLSRLAAEAAVLEAGERLTAAKRAAQAAAELRERIDDLVSGAERRERRLADTEKELAADKGGLAVRAERLASDRQRVAEAVGAHASVAERAAALARRAERATRLALVRRQESEATAEYERREAELAGVLAEQGFADAEAARSALLDAAARVALRAGADEHRTALARVTQRLEHERLVAVADAETTDEAPVREASEVAARALREALRHSGAANEASRLASEAAHELRRCADDVGRVRVEAEPYLRMADLANGVGANHDNVTLPTFVLLRRFEEVVDLANVRLAAMTGGRYSLRRTDAREGRSQKLGLGLEVIDHACGDAARDPKTLSGGETFQAALAMALGLADAVTAEAGGVELGTLFVDEGFGSLDPDALDTVMDQLSALRDGGRCVGVVSHVAEMKQRIAERVTVLPRRDGTSTLVCSIDPQPALAG